MSYLVDGNNVMGQRVGWHRDKAGARRRLLEELARMTRAARVTIAVVFDGAPDEHFPDGSSFMGVRVHYAARGSDADTRIKAMAETSRERRTLKVVTSDNALADYVRRCGVEVIRAGEFRRRLDEVAREGEAGAGAAKTELEGRGGVKASEVGEWLQYFGVAPEDDAPTTEAPAKNAQAKRVRASRGTQAGGGAGGKKDAGRRGAGGKRKR